jgi:LmbE family N-acetylglucosaminyl deacetylase
MKLLVIAPHPDDEVIGCGGTMARVAREGGEVSVLVVTRGVDELFPASVIEQTRAEAKRSHALLGVKDTTYLDFPAPRLDVTPRHQVADRIREEVRRSQPDVVLVPHPGDLHHDHEAVYYASLVACRPDSAWAAPTLYAYETMSETDWGAPIAANAFVPTQFVDVSEELTVKLDALACFETQMKPWPHPRSTRALESLARVRGATVGVEAAEAFAFLRGVITRERRLM